MNKSKTDMDIDIIREALSVYVAKMGDNIKEIKMASARGELTPQMAGQLCKAFEEQRVRAESALVETA